MKFIVASSFNSYHVCICISENIIYYIQEANHGSIVRQAAVIITKQLR